MNTTMANMPTAFWSGWVITITLVSLAGLVWLVFSIYFQKKHDEEKFVSPVWDESLTEGNHPAPMWWFWLILAALVISVVYLILYPGLGAFSGVLKWSQAGRLDNSLTAYAYQFGETNKRIKQSSLQTLQQDNMLMQSAGRIFRQHCAACHGVTAVGQADAFPDLTDAAWQWGGSHNDIEHSIRHGRQAVMVPWQDVLGDEGVTALVDYVKALPTIKDASSLEEGHQLFQQFCAACHGPGAKGNPALGAPDLTDSIWLYGNSEEQLRHTIALGRNGIMPAFDRRLSDAQIQLLVAWLSR